MERGLKPATTLRTTMAPQNVVAGFSPRLHLEARINSPCVAFKELFPVAAAQPGDRVDVPLGIVKIESGFRIDASHRSHHLRSEQDVVHRDDLQQQLNSGKVVDAGIEKDIVPYEIDQERPIHILGQTAIAAPVVRHSAAAVWNDESKSRKILEEIGRQKLHESGGVGIDVMGAGRVEIRVA